MIVRCIRRNRFGHVCVDPIWTVTFAAVVALRAIAGDHTRADEPEPAAVVVDAAFVGPILEGEARLEKAVASCAGTITRTRRPLGSDGVAGPAGSPQRLTFAIRRGSLRAELFVGDSDERSQVLLATPSESFRLLPVGDDDGAEGILTVFRNPDATEVREILDSDVLGIVGALLNVPGPRGSEFLASTKGSIERQSSDAVPEGISIRAESDGPADADPEGGVTAAGFELILDAGHDYAIRFMRSRARFPDHEQRLERTITLSSGPDGSFVPDTVTTRIVSVMTSGSRVTQGFEEVATVDFDPAPPSPETFTREWIEGLGKIARIDEVDPAGQPVPGPLPVLPPPNEDSERLAEDPRLRVSPWLIVNLAALGLLAAAWWVRNRRAGR